MAEFHVVRAAVWLLSCVRGSLAIENHPLRQQPGLRLRKSARPRPRMRDRVSRVRRRRIWPNRPICARTTQKTRFGQVQARWGTRPASDPGPAVATQRRRHRHHSDTRTRFRRISGLIPERLDHRNSLKPQELRRLGDTGLDPVTSCVSSIPACSKTALMAPRTRFFM